MGVRGPLHDVNGLRHYALMSQVVPLNWTIEWRTKLIHFSASFALNGDPFSSFKISMRQDVTPESLVQ